jgi:Na+/phosphate symporter
MPLKSVWAQTRREKLGTVDGINLFFGALLGANLGTTGGMRLYDYVELIVLLVAIVMAIRVMSVSERRGYSLAMLGGGVVLLLAVLLVPALQPKGMAADDLHRLIATILVWVASAVAIEFFPTRAGESEQAESDF